MNSNAFYGKQASLPKKIFPSAHWSIRSRILLLSFLSLGSIAARGQQNNTTYADNTVDYDTSGVTVQSEQAPPPLPDYVQPPCPADGYIWTPGYWAWATSGYYWVPGVWIMPPAIGLLWTPGYWGFFGGFYRWHHGYWGNSIGYYGGINYGFGYYGSGFYGGRWEGGHFMYNTAVWRVNNNIHNTYVSRDGIAMGKNRASFNGANGIQYRPNNDERAAIRQERVNASREQVEHERTMSNEQGQFHSNNPRPAVHSMSMPGGMRFDARGRGMGGRGGGGGRRR